MVTIILNGNPIEAQEDKTVLEVARSERIDIPTLCYHEVLGPYGACRLCLVEAEGPELKRSLVTSCTLQVCQGLSVETESPLVQKSRGVIFELLLGRAPDSVPLIELAGKYGVHSTRFKADHSEKCIRCGLCIRACRDKIHASALCFAGRGQKKRVTAEFGKRSETCIGCGACVALCPTQAILQEDVGEERKIFIQENTISILPMVNCRVCGTPFQTRKFMDYLLTNPDLREGLTVEPGICPTCSQKYYAAAITGEIRV
jgi:bidirectional [NiFe] hydrogenase diaphorase subunit